MWGQRSSRGQWPLIQVFCKKRSLYPHTLMYFHGTWTQWSLGRVTHKTSMWGPRSSRGQWPLVQVFCKKGHCIHVHWCIFMGPGHKWSLGRVTHMTSTALGSKIIQGSMTFSHLNRYGVKSNVTMIAQVCDHESRRDSWFKNRLVKA